MIVHWIKIRKGIQIDEDRQMYLPETDPIAKILQGTGTEKVVVHRRMGDQHIYQHPDNT